MPFDVGEPPLSRSIATTDLDDTDSSPPTPLPWTPRRRPLAQKRVLDDDDEEADADETPFKLADPDVEVIEIDDAIVIDDTEITESEDVVQAEQAEEPNLDEPILDWDDDYDNDAALDDSCDLTTDSTVELPISTLICPRSAAANYEPSLPVTTETHACDDLVPLAQAKARALKCIDYVYIELDDFEIYHSTSFTRDRLRSLSFLGGHGMDLMFFDGVLSVGNKRFYVQRVPFKYAPVDKYGPGFDTVRGHISIRSLLNSRRDVYYRLGRPSVVYARFYYPYLWVADLGKHFVDYVDKVTDKPGGDVRISHFRASFGRWLNKKYARSAAVKAWKSKFRPNALSCDVIDFRSAVIANKDYLRKEAWDVLGADIASALSFFREVKSEYYPTHVPKKPPNHPSNKPLPTVVTPYIFYTFRGLAVQKYMVSTPGKYTPKVVGNATLLPQGQSPFVTGESIKGESLADRIQRIQPGDIISTSPDDQKSGSKWAMDFEDRDEDEDELVQEAGKRWYALVHRVNGPQPRPDGRFDRDAQRSFEIAWLYAPQHTPCRQSTYPWRNELFLSDHCTCDEDGDACIQEDEVSGVHSVEWFGGPDTTADFFIRQTFLHGERSWIQLQLGHIFCESSAEQAFRVDWFQSRWPTISPIGQFEKEEKYAVGDTVLAVIAKRDTRSEPYIIEGTMDGYQLRVLLRRHELDASEAPPNELVYTDETIDLSRHSDGKPRKSARIIGRCIVRVFKNNETIPTPYCRNGAGNVFYITHRLAFGNYADTLETDALPLCVPMNEPVTFRQGFNPATPVPRLRALELFCGCGNLGRGIEDAGATETRCANDIWPVAMHTFMANVASEAVDPFIGSADTLLDYAIRGVHTVKAAKAPAVIKTTNIPRPGEIDFISGGSPCQGFSKLTPDRTTPQQFKNRSMVASFASFVDLYRPKFGILENVAAMADSKKDTGAKAEDIFGQLICALLGMGYQLRIMLGNAWFYGTPQKRQRVFIIFAAPGHTLPSVPLPSHGPSTQIMGGEQTTGVYKAIGDTSSSNWITTVLAPSATAFPFVSSGEAVADLEDIDDGVVDICVRHPDHRTIGVSDDMRCKLAQIPTQPYGLGLAEARHTREFRAVRHLFLKGQLSKPTTNAYKRHNPTRMFRTVRTSCVVADARGPGDVHWRGKRPLSIMEMRRAQGVPDDEVLLFERKADQWKMVGNAVARQIALALGLSLREAYLGSLYEGASGRQVVEEMVEVTEVKISPPKNRIFQTSPYASKTVVIRDKRSQSPATESESDLNRKRHQSRSTISLDIESD